MNLRSQQRRGFTLIEMIVVIVITGIIAGIVAIFIKAPVQGYVDSARRAELTDIADTAVRRLARDVRIAVPNSVRIAGCGSVRCVEFLPTRDGGRYRASPAGGGTGCNGYAGNTKQAALSFDAADTCFEIIGTTITFAAGDQIVIGSTQSDGNIPYQLPTSATSVRRSLAAAGVGSSQVVKMDSTIKLPDSAELPSHRFDVVDGTQQAVTYACTNVSTDANGTGTGQLVRYWGYGFNASQVNPPVGATIAILADKLSDCVITYDVPNQSFGLLAVRLTITEANESVTLYNEIHVNNAP